MTGMISSAVSHCVYVGGGVYGKLGILFFSQTSAHKNPGRGLPHHREDSQAWFPGIPFQWLWSTALKSAFSQAQTGIQLGISATAPLLPSPPRPMEKGTRGVLAQSVVTLRPPRCPHWREEEALCPLMGNY